jgi:hypothetical protein
MRTPFSSGKSETELVKAASRKLPKPDWYDADIDEVTEDTSKRGTEMFKAKVPFTDAAGTVWTLFDYLTDTPKGGFRLRRCCAARGVLAKLEAGSVDASDLPGPVRIKIGIEKRRSWPDRLVIEDYAAADSSSVVNLRAAGGER